ncbi:hypothetical protein GCM10020360_23300 [Nonlabens tegetincola]
MTVVALALGGSVAAQASTVKMPDRSGLIITKHEQPDEAGTPATGLPQDTGLPVIPGVTFEAYQVPLNNDPMTDAGRAEIAGIDLAEAQGKVSGVAATRSGTTDAQGQIHWQSSAAPGQKDGEDLGAGLWLVRETAAPAGVIRAGDFLVAVPLTDPTNGEQWLNTIYVYPKNQTVEGEKTVDNESDFTVGSTVTWRISIDNPSPFNALTGAYEPAEMFRVVDVLRDEYLSTDATGQDFTVVSPAGMVWGQDYTVTVEPGQSAGTTALTLEYTASGLDRLAEAPTERAVMELKTLVVKGGVIENSAQFWTSESQGEPGEIPGTSMKYGDYALIKKSAGTPVGALPSLSGAEFMVFTTEQDALDAQNDVPGAKDKAVRPAVNVPGYDPVAGTWTTNADGRVDITGLRYSGFANGESFGPGDPRYVTYWLVETRALEGHQLLAQPFSFIIDEDSATQTTEEIVNQYDRNGFVLPLTGGAGTLVLTIAGLALLATVLVVARRRSLAHRAAA